LRRSSHLFHPDWKQVNWIAASKELLWLSIALGNMQQDRPETRTRLGEGALKRRPV